MEGLYECGLANAQWHIDAGAKIRLLGNKNRIIHERSQSIIYNIFFFLKLIPRKWSINNKINEINSYYKFFLSIQEDR